MFTVDDVINEYDKLGLITDADLNEMCTEYVEYLGDRDIFIERLEGYLQDRNNEYIVDQQIKLAEIRKFTPGQLEYIENYRFDNVDMKAFEELK